MIPTNDPKPACCSEFFDAMEGLLEWLWLGIKNCIGDGDDDCSRMVRYVALGQPVVKPTQPNLLAVYLAPEGISTVGDRGAFQYRAVINIEMWEGCYPIPTSTNEEGIVLPPYAEWHKANRQVYAHALALYNRLATGMMDFTGELPTLLGPCQPGRPGPLTKIGNETGISVGHFTSLPVILG